MSVFKIHLFGKFCVRQNEEPAQGFDVLKEQELLSYLLINRNRPHSREALAGMLWGEVSTEKAKKYLRHALWRLQSAVGVLPPEEGGGGVLLVEHDWVQFDPKAGLWLDVEVFERAFMLVHDSSGAELEPPSVEALQEAVQLYCGDLLEGWYSDWCFYERERLQNMYLMMLDKLTSHCEAHRRFERGLFYGSQILRYDRARERTHRQLMSLQYMSGDRTAALRQYERCVAALDEELDVRPDKRTVALYERIRADGGETLPAQEPEGRGEPEAGTASLADVLGRLTQIQSILADVQQRVSKEIKAVRLALGDPRS
jgi:DNA-binding SARP family transcriptional activator